MEFREKLAMLRKQYGYSLRELSRMIGASPSAIRMWESGERQPKASNLSELARVFHCSEEYLTNPVYDIPEGSVSRTVRIPVLGEVAAGTPMYAEENITDYEEIPLSWTRQGDFFALKINGDSMKPRMHTGDVVIVRKQPTVDDGQTAVVLVNGDTATVKIVRHTNDGGVSLIPTNPDYSPLLYTAEQVENLPLTILGLVVELRVKFV
ncbi:MAG: helix-turn-helix domain-containing protein [Oscillospiraceae bacterium]|nr:helix-turn-helix domain-containing protein [Oscillospiraceae bacterium]